MPYFLYNFKNEQTSEKLKIPEDIERILVINLKSELTITY